MGACARQAAAITFLPRPVSFAEVYLLTAVQWWPALKNVHGRQTALLKRLRIQPIRNKCRLNLPQLSQAIDHWFRNCLNAVEIRQQLFGEASLQLSALTC